MSHSAIHKQAAIQATGSDRSRYLMHSLGNFPKALELTILKISKLAEKGTDKYALVYANPEYDK